MFSRFVLAEISLQLQIALVTVMVEKALAATSKSHCVALEVLRLTQGVLATSADRAAHPVRSAAPGAIAYATRLVEISTCRSEA